MGNNELGTDKAINEFIDNHNYPVKERLVWCGVCLGWHTESELDPEPLNS